MKIFLIVQVRNKIKTLSVTHIFKEIKFQILSLQLIMLLLIKASKNDKHSLLLNEIYTRKLTGDSVISQFVELVREENYENEINLEGTTYYIIAII